MMYARDGIKSGRQPVLRLGGQIREAACVAHARRKLHDLHAARPSSITSEALKRIARYIEWRTTFAAGPQKTVFPTGAGCAAA